MTSSGLVEKTATWPALLPLVGMPVAQKLWAIAGLGLTVLALGRLASGTSPGKTVTKPPLGPSWTMVTLTRIPEASAGKPKPAKVWPLSLKRRMVLGASGAAVTADPSG